MRMDDFTMFKKSKPFGYFPPDVEEKILEYEKTISQLTDKIHDVNVEKGELQQAISSLQNELRAMHIQMSHTELPDASDAVTHMVFDRFRKFNASDDPNVETLEPPRVNLGMSGIEQGEVEPVPDDLQPQALKSFGFEFVQPGEAAPKTFDIAE